MQKTFSAAVVDPGKSTLSDPIYLSRHLPWKYSSVYKWTNEKNTKRKMGKMCQIQDSKSDNLVVYGKMDKNSGLKMDKINKKQSQNGKQRLKINVGPRKLTLG